MHDAITYNRRYLRIYNLTRCVPGSVVTARRVCANTCGVLGAGLCIG